MFQNYLKIALRKLQRDKFYTLLNGFGLAIAMTAALLIFLWANDELSLYNFQQKGGRIHRVLATWPTDASMQTLAATPLPFADAAREGVPEVEKVCRFWNVQDVVLSHSDQRFGVDGLYLADAEFFDMFDFTLSQGDKKTVFEFPNNIVLTASLANRIFGTTDVVGQPLKVAGEIDLVVSGILEDVPSNSHIRFEALMPFRENIELLLGDLADTWDSFNFDTYVMLRPGVDKANMSKKLSALFPPKQDFQRENATFQLQPLTDVYLHSDFVKYSFAPQGNLTNIRLVGLIGLLILLIACVNYVNMSMARSAYHAKAVGVRKIVGASRWELFKQFLAETALLVGFASIIAVALAQLSLGFFGEISKKHFTENQIFAPETAWIIIATALVTILASGIQPALQLSNFRPMELLRGSHFTAATGKFGFRKILVTGQFACSGALIIGTLIMLAQLHFVKHEKLGYEREHIFTFHINEAEPLRVIHELKNQPGVLEVSASNQSIVNIGNGYRGFDYEGKDPNSDPFIRLINADENFNNFFGLKMAEGRWFLPGNTDYNGYILNETAVKNLGITDPLGKWMEFNNRRLPIVGVVKDFHFRSLHHEIEPVIFAQDTAWFRQIYVKTTGKNTSAAIAAAGQVLSVQEPNALFNYQFLDESYNQLYQSETRSGQLFLLFAFLAVFISCLGILGLATYAAERRSKEIGIRKILGASMASVVGLLSKDFIKPVFFAMLIASPLAWYFMHGWLQNFAYRIQICWWMFAIAGGLTLGIALLTVSLQSIKAALANPVKSLRSE